MLTGMARHSRHAPGWIPNQHGAWAMLIVPFLVGTVQRDQSIGLAAWLVPLAIAELAAYFCFYALTLWLRAAPRRRAEYRAPLLTYAIVTAVAATLVLVLGGWPLLGWLPLALALGGYAVWLAGQRRDRDASGGLATVAMAVGLGLAIRFMTPLELVRALPGAVPELAIFGLLFVYFGGTVWHVKALIRQRGQQPARTRAIGWHVAATLLAAVLAGLSVVNWGWPVFFALCLARTTWMTRPALDGRLRPAVIGVTEIVMSVLITIVALA